MKRSSILLLVFLAVVSGFSMVYLGCGVQNPLEPNWGYPTPTQIVPSVPVTIFNTASAVTFWSINTSMSSAPATIGFNSGFTSCSSLTGAMEVTIGFSGQNQAIYVLDALSPVVNLGGKTITAILEVNGGWNSDSGQIYGQIFLEQGSVAGDGVASAQLLSPGTGLWSASTSTPTSSGCVTFAMTLPATGPLSTNGNYSVYSGPFDPSQVQYIGLKVGTGGGGSGFQQTILDIKSWTFQ